MENLLKIVSKEILKIVASAIFLGIMLLAITLMTMKAVENGTSAPLIEQGLTIITVFVLLKIAQFKNMLKNMATYTKSTSKKHIREGNIRKIYRKESIAFISRFILEVYTLINAFTSYNGWTYFTSTYMMITYPLWTILTIAEGIFKENERRNLNKII